MRCRVESLQGRISLLTSEVEQLRHSNKSLVWERVNAQEDQIDGDQMDEVRDSVADSS